MAASLKRCVRCSELRHDLEESRRENRELRDDLRKLQDALIALQMPEAYQAVSRENDLRRAEREEEKILEARGEPTSLHQRILKEQYGGPVFRSPDELFDLLSKASERARPTERISEE